MGRYSDQDKGRVRDATDLVELAGEYTELRRAGPDRWTGRCPLHDERTPSFNVSAGKQLFKCFGCDAGGDVFTLVQAKEGLDFRAALELLARRAGIELDDEGEDPEAARRRRRRERQLELLERAAAFYAAHLRAPRSSEARKAAAYLVERGLGGRVLTRFGLGFSPADGSALVDAATAAGFSPEELTDAGLAVRRKGQGALRDRFCGRVMFPVSDPRGREVGFGARKLPGARGAKYVNSPAGTLYRKSDLLYGASQARAVAAKAGAVILVEGYTDALAMHQAGLENTVALMGTAISEQQVALLKRLAPTIVLLLDGDDAGAQAVLRAGALAQSSGLEVLVAELPADNDPAIVIAHHGADAARALVADARAFARWRVQSHIARADVSSAEAKDRVITELRDVFAEIPSSALREDLVVLVANQLTLDRSLVSSWLPTPATGAGDESATSRPPTAVAPTVPDATVAETATQRDELLRCVGDEQLAAGLPTGQQLERMFPDALARRAAEHIRTHSANPAADLPADDHELVSFITGLLSAATGLRRKVSVLSLDEHASS